VAGPPVTRAEALAIAEAYRTHEWVPTEANVKHGPDHQGILVNTPDVSYQKPGAVPGWWVPGQVNRGIPYQWGGFATPAEFDAGIRAGLAAGDVYTLEKRRLLESAVSREATGIDCSGFVSRCWKLSRAWSTRELATLCDPLVSWDDLRPGDILNTHNSHVALFAGWANPERTRLYTYETGVPPYWLVVRREVATRHLQSLWFVPLRYRGMRDS
jgi:cell wall-associated NlpC family hydrolase